MESRRRRATMSLRPEDTPSFQKRALTLTLTCVVLQAQLKTLYTRNRLVDSELPP